MITINNYNVPLHMYKPSSPNLKPLNTELSFSNPLA
uniref:Uncharacterized protein n=1 Tax=Rhizophora mucronata TaxID=61149 RepID=A0A2P2N6M1_RHIMU